MKQKLVEYARREYSPKQRMVALLIEAFIFIGILPVVFIRIGSMIDRWFQWSQLMYYPINSVLGWLLIAAGLSFCLWSIYAQFAIGRGTPVVFMATQKLVVQPPYAYCRNPMILGGAAWYLGVAVVNGSAGAVLLLALAVATLATYVKLVEEKELELRFGQEYLDYKKRTPFLLPHLRRKGKESDFS